MKNINFRRIIVVALILIVCFVLQSTVFQVLTFASIAPNLMIIIVSSFGFMRGRKEGMIIGFFAGLILDIFGGSYMGFYALLYMYVGYVNGYFRKLFYPEDIKLPLALIAGSDLSYGLLIYLLQFLLKNRYEFVYYLLHIIFPELVYTMVVTIVLYIVVLRINQKLEIVEKRSASKFG